MNVRDMGGEISANTSVRLIHDELVGRGISVEMVQLAHGTLLIFEYAGALRTISGTSPDMTAATGRTIANNKYVSFVVAKRIGVTTPETVRYLSDAQAVDFLHKHRRIAVKPINASHGDGVSVGISASKQLIQCLVEARHYSSEVLLQQMVDGIDVRVLVIGGEVVAVTERRPAAVVGDGQSTIYQLIKQENTNPLRGENYEKPLNKIDILQVERFLGKSCLNERVPLREDIVQVIGAANIGSGGTAINRTEGIPSALLGEAVSFAKAAGIFVCGVDFMYNASTDTWSFIEANSSPSFGLHTWPSEGTSINVAKIYVGRLLGAYTEN